MGIDRKDKTKYEQKLARAKKRVEEIKGFYTHLTIYLVVNLFLLLVAMGFLSGSPIIIGMPDWAHFTTPFFWGIGLALHGFWVFNPKATFFKDWEERKIKEIMEKEEKRRRNF